MLAWLQTHEPEVIARTRRLYLAKDFLRHALTGTWETDFSDAVGALMADDATKGVVGGDLWADRLGHCDVAAGAQADRRGWRGYG